MAGKFNVTISIGNINSDIKTNYRMADATL
jgi:hypothetical protein